MSTYTVVEAERKKDGKTKDGRDYTVWMLHLTDDNGPLSAEWFSCPPSPPPEPDSKLEGTVENTNFGVSFKPTRQGGGGIRGGGGKSPQESARIARMNSHAHALKYWELKRASDPSFPVRASDPSFPVRASWADYLKVVDLFYADVMAAQP